MGKRDWLAVFSNFPQPLFLFGSLARKTCNFHDSGTCFSLLEVNQFCAQVGSALQLQNSDIMNVFNSFFSVFERVEGRQLVVHALVTPCTYNKIIETNLSQDMV